MDGDAPHLIQVEPRHEVTAVGLRTALADAVRVVKFIKYDTHLVLGVVIKVGEDHICRSRDRPKTRFNQVITYILSNDLYFSKTAVGKG